jgi:hypothetical protein
MRSPDYRARTSESTSRRRLYFESLEDRRLLAADPQYDIKHPPYLQLGNAPLAGMPGSSADQIEIIWQTVSAGSGTQDTFVVDYRRAGNAVWNPAGPINTIDTGVEGRITNEQLRTLLQAYEESLRSYTYLTDGS